MQMLETGETILILGVIANIAVLTALGLREKRRRERRQ
jgi:hypothetical protein